MFEPTLDDIDRAIARVEESRESHVSWINWYSEDPTREQQPAQTFAETAGDAAHHQRCIEGYDHVLAVLEATKAKIHA